MEAVIQDLKHYLQETLGICLNPKPWRGAKNLPFFLQDFYSFYTVLLLMKPFILAVPRGSGELTPALVRKNLEQLQAKAGIPCIYVCKTISSYDRKRLIQHGIQFVIPHRQTYLPGLGVDWLDRYRSCQTHRSIHRIMPSTQAVVIYALTHQNEKQFIPLKLAKALNYTPMTMTRALNELEMVGLGKAVRKGKERWFCFAENRSLLWKQAEPLMQNPVKKRLWLRLEKSNIKEVETVGVLAGLSALAELTPPIHPIYAVSSEVWKRLQQLGTVQELPSAEEADIELEVWSYNPKLFAKGGLVDFFSLYLSLKGTQNERVEIALEKLIKDIKW